MDIFKIALLGVVGIMPAVILKSIKSEYALLVAVSVALVIFFFAISKVSVIVAAIQGFMDYANIQEKYVVLLLKMTGVTYVAEFSAALCRDAGYSAVASQIEIFAKLSILLIGIPVITALLETIEGSF